MKDFWHKRYYLPQLQLPKIPTTIKWGIYFVVIYSVLLLITLVDMFDASLLILNILVFPIVAPILLLQLDVGFATVIIISLVFVFIIGLVIGNKVGTIQNR